MMNALIAGVTILCMRDCRIRFERRSLLISLSNIGSKSLPVNVVISASHGCVALNQWGSAVVDPGCFSLEWRVWVHNVLNL